MKLVNTKTVEKLLQSLNNDPRLQALDDTTILSEEQWLAWRVLASTGPVLHSTHFICGTRVLWRVLW